MSIRPTNSKDALKDEDSDQPQSDDESRLSRWSRRKRDLSRQRSDSIADAEDNAERSLSSDTLEDASTQLPLGGADDGSGDLKNADTEDKPLLTDADMPDIETLTPDSDFKPFMSKGVSHALRRKALRKLFASPFFQIRDGLDDYDDDFTSFAPLGDTVTADMKKPKPRGSETASSLPATMNRIRIILNKRRQTNRRSRRSKLIRRQRCFLMMSLM